MGSTHKELTALDAAADLGEPAATAWRKFDNWFFRECVFGARRHLYAMFDMPLGEIRNHGHERHALRHIRKQLQGLEPTDRTLSLTARIEELEAENARYRQALEDIINPLSKFQRDAERTGARLSSMAYSIANDLVTVQGFARAALNGGGDGE